MGKLITNTSKYVNKSVLHYPPQQKHCSREHEMVVVHVRTATTTIVFSWRQGRTILVEGIEFTIAGAAAIEALAGSRNSIRTFKGETKLESFGTHVAVANETVVRQQVSTDAVRERRVARAFALLGSSHKVGLRH